jgi:hypothetical protein
MLNNSLARVAATFLLSITFPCAAVAGAMRNEPGDFKGFPWGAPLKVHSQALTLLTGDEQTASYRRESDSKTFASVDAWRISYRFYKQRFSSGTVVIVGSSNLKSVLDYLTQTYGPPESVHPRHRIYEWQGENSGISVSCDISISCYVEFYGKEMRALELAEQGNVPDNVKRDD